MKMLLIAGLTLIATSAFANERGCGKSQNGHSICATVEAGAKNSKILSNITSEGLWLKKDKFHARSTCEALGLGKVLDSSSARRTSDYFFGGSGQDRLNLKKDEATTSFGGKLKVLATVTCSSL